jgi:hypothetical protein
MAALPPRSARPRPRPGSLERPINARLYRGTWLLVGIPLLVAAFSVGKSQALRPAEPRLPPSFDRAGALALASELSHEYPDRSPGSSGLREAATWFAAQLAPYGFRVERERFRATIPGRGRVRLENLIVVVPGRSPESLAVLAHLDDSGAGPGADDNASGVAALLELARSYAGTGGAASPSGGRLVSPAHTLLFVATEGGASGGIGADRFAHAYRTRVLAGIDLDSVGGSGRPRLAFAGDTARLANPTLVETAAARIAEQVGARPAHPGWLGQLIDLAFPFTLDEQGPLVAQGIPAVTLTSAGERPPRAFTDTPEHLDQIRLAQLGRAAQELLRTLDQEVELAPGTASYVYVGPRIIRGWAIELVLIAALLPFLIVAVDLFARCRRRRIALAPALRSYRSRLAFWLWVGAAFEFFAVVGVWPRGTALPPLPDSRAAGDWPVLGLLGLALLSGVGWIIVRDRLVPRRPIAATEELAGHVAALLALGLVGLLVVATNPFALLFVLPSLHTWLWLPQVQTRPWWTKAAVLLAGFLGPLVLLLSFGVRYGLGFDAPWYVLELVVLHFVELPTLVIGLVWAAAAAQLAALAAGRYAPYPDVAERRALGPVRATVRRVVLATRRRRRRAPERPPQALEG